jgi:hypothetical protein
MAEYLVDKTKSQALISLLSFNIITTLQGGGFRALFHAIYTYLMQLNHILSKTRSSSRIPRLLILVFFGMLTFG